MTLAAAIRLKLLRSWIAGKMGLLRRIIYLHRLALAAGLFLFCSGGFAQKRSAEGKIQAILFLPEDKIDLLRLKLVVDQYVDPSSDVGKTEKMIESIVSDIRATLPARATSIQKLEAIRRYLYEKGPWNSFQPFQYDYNDPKGTNIKAKTLSRYIETRKGNCVSMPMLLIVLADRLGLDVSASTAPDHVLVKFTETETGRTYNVEATSGGGFAREQWYQDQFKITAQAMASGIYLQKLSKKETASVIVTLLGEHYFQQGDYENAIKVFVWALKLHPKSVYSMLKIGASYAKLFNQRFANKYQTVEDVPVRDRSLLNFYVAQNKKYFEMAESHGWREPGSVLRDEYSRRVNEAKKQSKQYGS